jgi:hypothetical protein
MFASEDTITTFAKEATITAFAPQATTFAVVVYGEFRTYAINLRENLKELFGEFKCPIHFYVLTEDCDDYDAKKEEICGILKRPHCKVLYFEKIKDCALYDQAEEDRVCSDYFAIPGPADRDVFTPRLYYRKGLVNKVMTAYAEANGVTYEKVFSVRLFDMVMKRCRSLQWIQQDTQDKLYYGGDNLFIGSPAIITELYSTPLISDAIAVDDAHEFRRFYAQNDFYLSQIMPKLALETIFQALIYKRFLGRSMNLRYDFTRHNLNLMWNKALIDNTCRADIIEFALPFIDKDYLLLLHCPRRK